MSDPEPIFLTVDQVLAVHRRVIEEFGGSTELRDRGLLESAVAMPAATFGGRYLHASLGAMAAAYFFHLCRNHAFLDGNKRTALAAAEVFLLVNDARLSATNDELERLTLAVADGTGSKPETVAFFEARTSRVS
jgi:death on curing protein